MLAMSLRNRRTTRSTSVLSHAPSGEAEYRPSHPALFSFLVWCDHRLQFYIFTVMFFVLIHFIFSLAYCIKKADLNKVRQWVLYCTHKSMDIIFLRRKYRKSKEHRAKMYNFLIKSLFVYVSHRTTTDLMHYDILHSTARMSMFNPLDSRQELSSAALQGYPPADRWCCCKVSEPTTSTSSTTTSSSSGGSSAGPGRPPATPPEEPGAARGD